MSDQSLFPELDTQPAPELPKKRSRAETFNDYDAFVEKFKPKKTTDDCYTPPAVYEVVKQWVNDNIMNLDSVEIVRPFYPDGDYENADYPDGCLVLDNPPFSILAKIRRFYHARNIKYFLFGPTLTLANSAKDLTETFIITGESIVYENGATVRTSFLTNLDCVGVEVWCSGNLAKKLKEVNCGKIYKPELPILEYPVNVVSPAILQKIPQRGIELKIHRDSCKRISKIESNPRGIFGGGWLLSERAAAERAAAERAAAERAAAERAATERAAARNRITFTLSDAEKEIISKLK